MSQSEYLTNQFLIAMPGLDDANFARTVTYICEHNADGAMGIVINRPMEIRLADILAQLDIEDISHSGDQIVFNGGPVQPDRGFLLHTGDRSWDSTLRITPEISVTTSRDILASIAHGEGPQRCLIALGYAGWGSGQLEKEISANSWLSGPADARILFETPVEQRWHAAARLLGVEMDLMTQQAGHA